MLEKIVRLEDINAELIAALKRIADTDNYNLGGDWSAKGKGPIQIASEAIEESNK